MQIEQCFLLCVASFVCVLRAYCLWNRNRTVTYKSFEFISHVVETKNKSYIFILYMFIQWQHVFFFSRSFLTATSTLMFHLFLTRFQIATWNEWLSDRNNNNNKIAKYDTTVVKQQQQKSIEFKFNSRWTASLQSEQKWRDYSQNVMWAIQRW